MVRAPTPRRRPSRTPLRLSIASFFSKAKPARRAAAPLPPNDRKGLRMIRPQPEVYADLERGALLDVRAENIPGELKARPQWVNYKAIQKPDGRLDKVPYTPGTDRKASTTDLMTWGTFGEAIEGLGRFDGLGFV